MLNIEFWCSLLNYLLKQTISLQFFKGSLPQDLLSPLLNTFNQIILSIVAVCLRFYARASRAEVYSEPCQASKMKRFFFKKNWRYLAVKHLLKMFNLKLLAEFWIRLYKKCKFKISELTWNTSNLSCNGWIPGKYNFIVFDCIFLHLRHTNETAKNVSS